MLNAVDISNLTVKYPDVTALDDVSFAIKQGDFLGIIGPNGAGKSTLFDSMLGLNTNYVGTIKFFDEDIKKSKTYHKEIGYVPQKPEFENNFPATVSEVVRMGLRKKSDDKKVDEILQQLWIHELRNRRIGELSGGQLQRVFIAKALVNNPKILILDEPVTGVDQQSIELFFSILRELNSKQKTVKPKKFNKDNTPLPLGNDVEVYQSEAGYFAAFKFSGYTNLKKEQMVIKKGKAFLMENNISYKDSPIVLVYNSPYAFFNRKNEILFPVYYSK